MEKNITSNEEAAAKLTSFDIGIYIETNLIDFILELYGFFSTEKLKLFYVVFPTILFIS